MAGNTIYTAHDDCSLGWANLCYYSQSSKVWYSNPSYTIHYTKYIVHCVCAAEKRKCSLHYIRKLKVLSDSVPRPR